MLINTAVEQLVKNELTLTSSEPLSSYMPFSAIPAWDSLNHMKILHKIQHDFDISISTDNLAQTFTIDGLCNLIAKQNAAQPPKNKAIYKTWLDLFAATGLDARLRDKTFIFCHSRYQALLGLCEENIAELINTLRFKIGKPKTLIFPGYPFTADTYASYIDKHAKFDTRKTPAQTGLIAETVRQMTGCVRSLHPVLSQCALGEQLGTLYDDELAAPEIFHARAPYLKLVEADACLLGLGVNTNTNTFIHMVDDRFANAYPFKLYEDELYEFEIKTSDQPSFHYRCQVYKKGLFRQMQPIQLQKILCNEPFFFEIEHQQCPFYAIALQEYIRSCMKIAEAALHTNSLPPWIRLPTPSNGPKPC